MIPKSIIKEVQKVWNTMRITSTISFDDDYLLFKRRLNRLGYKTPRHIKNNGAFNCFVVEKEGYVVKNFGGFEGKKKPKMCVDTYFIDDYHNIAIQPLVDTRSEKAKQLIKDFAESYVGDYDFHDKNLGLYKNKLVCFDW